MDKLFAQRTQFINSFYTVKQNTIDNRMRLIACARALAKKQHPFFSCGNSVVAVELLHQDKTLCIPHNLLMVLLYNNIHQQPQLLLQSLYRSNNPLLSQIAPLFALVLQIQDSPLTPSIHEQMLHNQLIGCFYRQQQSTINDFYVEYSDRSSAFIQLSLTVLDRTQPLNSALLSRFIDLKVTHGTLFELYIVALNKVEINKIVDQLTGSDDVMKESENSQLLIHILELSGFSEFTPLLAEYLQKPEYTIRAHHALRVLLGDLLDTLIPYPIQFNSDIEQQKLDFPYYGAKILHFWETKLKPTLPDRILSGKAITVKNLVMLEQQGSQEHRRIANLHHIHLSTSMQVPYYAVPEMVL
ncbi:hypothetical protein ACR30L_09665 [Psychromonas sp. PT13]|uniref:hypothetical protein n=1 Tax=Psychromonas sp. PT13 TaxID=3439547 RepID=UPI003EBC32B3